MREALVATLGTALLSIGTTNVNVKSTHSFAAARALLNFCWVVQLRSASRVAHWTRCGLRLRTLLVGFLAA